MQIGQLSSVRKLLINCFYFLENFTLKILFYPYNPWDWTKKKSFCPAPWIHAHLDATGCRRLCCIAQDPPAEVSQLSIKDFWNSSYMKSVRHQMMSGILPTECKNCSVPNKVDTYQQGLKNNFWRHFAKIRKSTSTDGESHYPLLFLDYRSKKCNLMCKFCGPESSSRWIESANKDADIMKLLQNESYVDMLIKKSSESRYETEFLPLVEKNPIEKIYFAGGEPLLASQHFSVLNKLIENGQSQNIFLSYNTNLTISDGVFQTWLEKLAHFKKVELYCSIDGAEDITTYIRTGMNYAQFIKNIDQLKIFKKKHKKFYFNFDVTMTSLFCLNLVEFSQLAISHQVPVDAKLMLGYEYKSLFLRCEFLPQHLRAQLIDDWLVYYNTLNLQGMKLLAKMKMNLEIVRNLPQFGPDDIHQGLLQSQTHDLVFKEEQKFSSFLKRNEIASKWWQSISHIDRV